MELRYRKYINNNKEDLKIPEYADGTVPEISTTPKTSYTPPSDAG
jgi:hypothetical protein